MIPCRVDNLLDDVDHGAGRWTRHEAEPRTQSSSAEKSVRTLRLMMVDQTVETVRIRRYIKIGNNDSLTRSLLFVHSIHLIFPALSVLSRDFRRDLPQEFRLISSNTPIPGSCSHVNSERFLP